MPDRSEQKRVVGVYPDEATAQEAASAAREAGARDVRVDDPADEVASLLGEQREETGEAWAGPTVGIYTKEMARNVPLWTVAGALIGAVVALPAGFLGGEGLSLSTRMLVAAFGGAMFGGTIGFLVGGGFFEPRRKSAANLAAEEGVVVGAEEAGGEVDATDRALAGHDPVRVDRISSSGPVDTVTTEETDDDAS